MANEYVIDEIINRPAIDADKNYLIKSIEEILEAVKQVKSPRIETANTSGDMAELVKNMNKAAEAAVKSDKTIAELSKKVKELQDALKKAGDETTKTTKKREALTLAEAKAQEELKKTNAQTRLAAKESLAAANSYEALSTKMNALKAAALKMDVGSKAFADAQKEILGLNTRLKELDAQQGNFQRNVGNYSGAVVVLKERLEEVREELVKLNSGPSAGAELTIDDAILPGYEALTKEMELLNTLVDSQEAGFANATQELRANKRALQDMEAAGLAGTDAYNELAQATGELSDQLGDLNTRVKNLGSDTFAFDGLLEAGEGLTSIYGAAAGAAEVLGISQEDLQKQMAKFQAILTIITSLQSLRNVVQKESSAMLLLESVRTKAAAAAQVLYTFAVGGSTGAMKALRITLLATGIGAIIVLLAAAADAMGVFDDSTEGVTESLEDQTTAANALVSSLEGIANAAKAARAAQSGGIDDLKRQLELTKARGTSAQDVFDLEQKIRAKELRELKILADNELHLYETKKKNGQLTEGLADVLNEKITALNKEGLDKANEIESAKLAFFKQQSDEATKKAKEAADKRRAYSEAELKAQYEIIQLRLKYESDAFKKIVDSDEEGAATRLGSLIYFYDIQKQLIENQRKFELTNAKLTVSEREKIQVEAEIKLNELTVEGSDARKKILVKSREDEEAEMKAFAEGFAVDVDKLKSDLESQVGKDGITMFKLNDDEYTAQLGKLTEKLKSGLIGYEDYQKQKEAIDLDFAHRTLSQAEQTAQALISGAKARGIDVVEYEKQLNEAKRALYNTDAQNLIAAEEKKKAARLKSLEEIAAGISTFTEFSNSVLGTITELSSIALDREKTVVEEQNASQEKAYEAEVKRISALNISDQQRADMLTTLEARRTAEKEATDRKLRKIEIERARYEKAANIASIITSTALAVVNAIKTYPGPLGIALGVAVGAIGAAQLARAIATPLPKFATGTDDAPEGFAITGEKGIEKVIEPSGKQWYTPATASLTYLKKGSKVIPHHKLFEDAMDTMIMSSLRPVAPISEGDFNRAYIQALETKIEAMGNKIENAINNKPVPTITNTWAGLQLSIKQGHNMIEKKNWYNS